MRIIKGSVGAGDSVVRCGGAGAGGLALRSLSMSSQALGTSEESIFQKELTNIKEMEVSLMC